MKPDRHGSSPITNVFGCGAEHGALVLVQLDGRFGDQPSCFSTISEAWEYRLIDSVSLREIAAAAGQRNSSAALVSIS